MCVVHVTVCACAHVQSSITFPLPFRLLVAVHVQSMSVEVRKSAGVGSVRPSTAWVLGLKPRSTGWAARGFNC